MSLERIFCWILIISGAFEGITLIGLLFEISDLKALIGYLAIFGSGWLVYFGWASIALFKWNPKRKKIFWSASLILHLIWAVILFADFDPSGKALVYLQVRIHVLLALSLSLILLFIRNVEPVDGINSVTSLRDSTS